MQRPREIFQALWTTVFLVTTQSVKQCESCPKWCMSECDCVSVKLLKNEIRALYEREMDLVKELQLADVCPRTIESHS